MNRFNEVLHSLGIDTGLLVVGFFSVMATLKKLMLEKNTAARIGYVFTGLGASVYLTPLVIDVVKHFYNLTNVYGVGFLVGYTAQNTIQLLHQLIKNKVRKTKI